MDEHYVRKQAKLKAMEKVESYAKYVKEMYWPKVSEEKKIELEEFRSKEKAKTMKKSQSAKHIIDEKNHKQDYLTNLIDKKVTENQFKSSEPYHSSPGKNQIKLLIYQIIVPKKPKQWEVSKNRFGASSNLQS